MHSTRSWIAHGGPKTNLATSYIERVVIALVTATKNRETYAMASRMFSRKPRSRFQNLFVSAASAVAVAAAGSFALIDTARADDVCPKRGGILKTVDMHYKLVDPSQRANPIYFMRLVYDSLLDISEDLGLTPGLAESMPQQADNTTVMF